MNETRSAHLVRELRALTSRIRGLSIHDQAEADTWREALSELEVHVNLAIRVREAADA